MKHTKLTIYTLTFLFILLLFAKFSGIRLSQKYSFSFNSLAGEQSIPSKTKQSQGLKKIIDKNLKDKNQNDFAIYIENLKTEEKFTLNETENFDSASLYKLFLLAAIYDAIEKGEWSEETEISSTRSHLEAVLGFEDFGYQDAPENLTYKLPSIISRIATISDNYASIMAAEKLGWDRVQMQADQIGAKRTSIRAPIQTIVYDIALFFKKLYRGEIVSKEGSEKIIDILSKSKINDRIPQKLPEGIKIAHKTAELSKLRHDAGIVFLPENPYIIVLMSRNLEFEDEGVELLAMISKEVYDYFKIR